MIKHLGIALVAAALLTGCGGGDDKTKVIAVIGGSSTPASSTPASSTPASVAASVAASSMPASTAASSMPASAAASSAVAVANKVLKIDVTNGSTVVWHLQLQQALKGLDKTKTYTFSYKIKASVAKTVEVLVTTGADDYISYPSPTTVDVTTDWQTKTLSVVPTTNDSTVFFQANLGAVGTYQIWLDDISLTDVGGGNEQVTNGSIVDLADWSLGKNGGTADGAMTIETVTP